MHEGNASWPDSPCGIRSRLARLGEQMSVCVLHFVREPVPDFQCRAAFVCDLVREVSLSAAKAPLSA